MPLLLKTTTNNIPDEFTMSTNNGSSVNESNWIEYDGIINPMIRVELLTSLNYTQLNISSQKLHFYYEIQKNNSSVHSGTLVFNGINSFSSTLPSALFSTIPFSTYNTSGKNSYKLRLKITKVERTTVSTSGSSQTFNTSNLSGVFQCKVMIGSYIHILTRPNYVLLEKMQIGTGVNIKQYWTQPAQLNLTEGSLISSIDKVLQGYEPMSGIFDMGSNTTNRSPLAKVGDELKNNQDLVYDGTSIRVFAKDINNENITETITISKNSYTVCSEFNSWYRTINSRLKAPILSQSGNNLVAQNPNNINCYIHFYSPSEGSDTISINANQTKTIASSLSVAEEWEAYLSETALDGDTDSDYAHFDFVFSLSNPVVYEMNYDRRYIVTNNNSIPVNLYMHYNNTGTGTYIDTISANDWTYAYFRDDFQEGREFGSRCYFKFTNLINSSTSSWVSKHRLDDDESDYYGRLSRPGLKISGPIRSSNLSVKNTNNQAVYLYINYNNEWYSYSLSANEERSNIITGIDMRIVFLDIALVEAYVAVANADLAQYWYLPSNEAQWFGNSATGTYVYGNLVLPNIILSNNNRSLCIENKNEVSVTAWYKINNSTSYTSITIQANRSTTINTSSMISVASVYFMTSAAGYYTSGTISKQFSTQLLPPVIMDVDVSSGHIYYITIYNPNSVAAIAELDDGQTLNISAYGTATFDHVQDSWYYVWFNSIPGSYTESSKIRVNAFDWEDEGGY